MNIKDLILLVWLAFGIWAVTVIAISFYLFLFKKRGG